MQFTGIQEYIAEINQSIINSRIISGFLEK
jgi:hypothetical protein